jgi:hypothetical protein
MEFEPSGPCVGDPCGKPKPLVAVGCLLDIEVGEPSHTQARQLFRGGLCIVNIYGQSNERKGESNERRGSGRESARHRQHCNF